MDQRNRYRKIAHISTVVKRTGRMGLVPAALLLVGTYCAEEKQESAAVPDPDPIIAQVGDKAITLRQFRAFSRDIPKYLQSEKTGLERVRNHLQTMIDRELLALEALDQSIDQSPRFLKNMRRFKEKRLLAAFQAREIRGENNPGRSGGILRKRRFVQGGQIRRNTGRRRRQSGGRRGGTQGGQEL